MPRFFAYGINKFSHGEDEGHLEFLITELALIRGK